MTMFRPEPALDPEGDGAELKEFTPVVSAPPLEIPGLPKIDAVKTGDE
jgi:hypothetical protein